MESRSQFCCLAKVVLRTALCVLTEQQCLAAFPRVGGLSPNTAVAPRVSALSARERQWTGPPNAEEMSPS